MLVLGLSAHAPEAAAALVRDGVPVAAAREELFTGVRADATFPRRAARACLLAAGASVDDLDAVVYFTKPLRRFERELATALRGFPASSGQFARSMFLWLGDRLWMRNAIQAELGVPAERILFVEHHEAHAASAFLGSPFDEAAVLTSSPDGEWATVALAHALRRGAGQGFELRVLRELHHPHAPSRLVGAVMRFLALDPHEDEGRLAALAGLGRPRFVEGLRELAVVGSDGGFELADTLARRDDPASDLRVLGERFGAPRLASEPLRISGDDTRDADLAASLRALLVELHLSLLRSLRELAPCETLCLGGSLARDVGLGARLIAEGPFERVYVDPAAGNGAAALGAALSASPSAGVDAGPRGVRWLRLGPEAAGGVAAAARAEPARVLADPRELVEAVAGELAAGRVVGWMQGRAELAGRSFGARSLLADPRSPELAHRIRSEIKRREAFVPFGAIATVERARELFELDERGALAAAEGMLAVRARPGAQPALGGVLHADGTVRLRVVTSEDEPELHAVLARFAERTGAPPVLLHTTLRLFGEPPCRHEADGLRMLERSRLDCLVVGTRLYSGAAPERG